MSSTRTRLASKATATLLAAALSGVAAPAFAQDDFGGRWSSTTFGAMRLHQEDDGGVRGEYDFHGGRLRGHVDDRTLSGVWTQDSAGEPCEEEKMGTHYWGHFEFRINRDGDAFHGWWSYCDSDTHQGDWDGRRRGPAADQPARG